MRLSSLWSASSPDEGQPSSPQSSAGRPLFTVDLTARTAVRSSGSMRISSEATRLMARACR
eukprot:5925870-Pyramimonas_sp.AAC.1